MKHVLSSMTPRGRRNPARWIDRFFHSRHHKARTQSQPGTEPSAPSLPQRRRDAEGAYIDMINRTEVGSEPVLPALLSGLPFSAPLRLCVSARDSCSLEELPRDGGILCAVIRAIPVRADRTLNVQSARDPAAHEARITAVKMRDFELVGCAVPSRGTLPWAVRSHA